MKSIAEIFDNSKQLLDSITNFIDKYIGASLLRKCNITKIVDSITESTAYSGTNLQHAHCLQWKGHGQD